MNLPLKLIINKQSYSGAIGYNFGLKRIIKNKCCGYIRKCELAAKLIAYSETL